MSMKNYRNFLFFYFALVAILFALTTIKLSAADLDPEPASQTTLVYYEQPDTEPDAPEPEPEPSPAPTYTEDDLFVMAVIIYQEAGGDACSDETRIMVGNVVMNRVADSRFPNTIREVALGHRQYGTLYKTGVKFPERASNPGEKHAVERAYEIAKRVLEGERLLDSDVIWQAEFKQGKGTRFYQDGIYFCY